MLLQRIGDWITWEQNNSKQVVIWISLANLKRRQSLENYLLNDWFNKFKEHAIQSSVTPADLKQLFKAGNVWLLMDGVDEISALYDSPLKSITDQINQSEWISKAKIILTCRSNIWEANKNLLEKFDIYKILDFSYNNDENIDISDQVGEFISRWFANDLDNGRKLREELSIRGKERIRDLAKKPLFLSLLCIVWEQSNQLPDTRAELYRQFVEEIYKWKEFTFKDDGIIEWAKPRPFLNKGKREQLNKELAKLAKLSFEAKFVPNQSKNLLDKINKKQIPASLDKLVQFSLIIWSKAGLEEQESPFRISHQLASSVLRSDLQMALDLGWLNQVGVSQNNPNQPIYAFSHPSFHEYFAAQAIDSSDYLLKHNNAYVIHPNDGEYLLKHNNAAFVIHPNDGEYRIFKPYWRDITLLWFGHKEIYEYKYFRKKFNRADKLKKETFLQETMEF